MMIISNVLAIMGLISLGVMIKSISSWWSAKASMTAYLAFVILMGAAKTLATMA